MLLLCSNGLTSDPLMACAAEKARGGTAALVVTADPVYKERNYHVPRCRDELTALGFAVELFDLDVQPAADLLHCDAVEFIGGNPYYLLKSLREHRAKDTLEAIAQDRLLIGWSAGTLAMGPTIGIIDRYSPEMNAWNLTDLTGMCLTERQILPHCSKFLTRYDRFEERCRAYEEENHCEVIRLSDGEGVRIEGNTASVIRSTAVRFQA